MVSGFVSEALLSGVKFREVSREKLVVTARAVVASQGWGTGEFGGGALLERGRLFEETVDL